MKKFLSLVLALAMAMSLVTISAGAKDFTDDSKITYKEAVDVVSDSVLMPIDSNKLRTTIIQRSQTIFLIYKVCLLLLLHCIITTDI